MILPSLSEIAPQTILPAELKIDKKEPVVTANMLASSAVIPPEIS
jgi:hypothetical protein